jgi:hypothetical protein
MDSYLVIRSKPGTLGYFVVDYNPTVQSNSPPNRIPYTYATLQFLSEKVFFTPLKKKKTYISLKMDEASRALSNLNNSISGLSMDICTHRSQSKNDSLGTCIRFHREADT